MSPGQNSCVAECAFPIGIAGRCTAITNGLPRVVFYLGADVDARAINISIAPVVQTWATRAPRLRPLASLIKTRRLRTFRQAIRFSLAYSGSGFELAPGSDPQGRVPHYPWNRPDRTAARAPHRRCGSPRASGAFGSYEQFICGDGWSGRSTSRHDGMRPQVGAGPRAAVPH